MDEFHTLQSMTLPSNPNENGGPNILIATLLVTVLATITVLARIYVRSFMIRNPGWDVSRKPCLSPVLAFYNVQY